MQSVEFGKVTNEDQYDCQTNKNEKGCSYDTLTHQSAHLPKVSSVPKASSAHSRVDL